MGRGKRLKAGLGAALQERRAAAIPTRPPAAAPSGLDLSAVPTVTGFQVTEWCGKVRYACERCKFATLNLEAARYHKATDCGRKRPRVQED